MFLTPQDRSEIRFKCKAMPCLEFLNKPDTGVPAVTNAIGHTDYSALKVALRLRSAFTTVSFFFFLFALPLQSGSSSESESGPSAQHTPVTIFHSL